MSIDGCEVRNVNEVPQCIQVIVHAEIFELLEVYLDIKNGKIPSDLSYDILDQWLGNDFKRMKPGFLYILQQLAIHETVIELQQLAIHETTIKKFVRKYSAFFDKAEASMRDIMSDHPEFRDLSDEARPKTAIFEYLFVP